MNANELADALQETEPYYSTDYKLFDKAATMLRQQQEEIEALKAKTLTDEEINVVAILQDAEIVPVGHEIWKTGEEFNKYKKIVLATAKALRKAQEK